MKKNSVTWFTANANGGILQLVQTLNEEAAEAGWDSIAVVPSGADASSWATTYEKTLNPMKMRASVSGASDILKARGEGLTVLCDTSTFSLLVARGCGVEGCFIMNHDVINHEISGTASAYDRVSRAINTRLKNRILARSGGVVLLSSSSEEEFKRLCPEAVSKTHVLPLGAHNVAKAAVCPPELGDCENYALFFGRIEPYKGLSRLFEAWSLFQDQASDEERHILVIAGSGRLSDEERRLVAVSRNVVLINRFISDEELNWLFENCAFSVLPYVKATQSGIIPISYKFGKPVVVSGDVGLTQFVDEGKTGLVCRGEGDFASAFDDLWSDAARLGALSRACIDYYEEKLDWSRSVPRFLGELTCSIERRGV